MGGYDSDVEMTEPGPTEHGIILRWGADGYRFNGKFTSGRLSVTIPYSEKFDSEGWPVDNKVQFLQYLEAHGRRF